MEAWDVCIYVSFYLIHARMMGPQADSPPAPRPILLYVWKAEQEHRPLLDLQNPPETGGSLWEAKPQGYVRPQFFFQFNEQPKKFCLCHSLPGLGKVPCTGAEQNLATLVLSRTTSTLAVCLFQRCFLLRPTRALLCTESYGQGESCHALSLCRLWSMLVCLQDVTQDNNLGDQTV